MRLGSFLKRGLSAVGLGGILLSSTAGCEKTSIKHPEAVAVEDTRREVRRVATPLAPKTPEKKPATESTREKVTYTFTPPPPPKKEVQAEERAKTRPTPPPPPKAKKPVPTPKKESKVVKKAIKIPTLLPDRGYTGPLAVGEEAPVQEEIITLNDEDLLDITVTQQPKNPPLKEVKKTGRRPGPPPLKNVRPKKDGKENTLLSSKPKKERPALLAVNTYQQKGELAPRPKSSGSVVNQQVQIVTPPSVTPPIVSPTPQQPASSFNSLDEGWDEIMAQYEPDTCPPELISLDEEGEIMELCEGDFEILDDDDDTSNPSPVMAKTGATPPPPPPLPEKNKSLEDLEKFVMAHRKELLLILTGIILYLIYRRRKKVQKVLHMATPGIHKNRVISRPRARTMSFEPLTPIPQPPAEATSALKTLAGSTLNEATMRLPAIEQVLFLEGELGVEMSDERTIRHAPEIELFELEQLYNAIGALEKLNLDVQKLELLLGRPERKCFVHLTGEEKINHFVRVIKGCEGNTPSGINNSRLRRHNRALSQACLKLIETIDGIQSQAEGDFMSLNKLLVAEESREMEIVGEMDSKPSEFLEGEIFDDTTLPTEDDYPFDDDIAEMEQTVMSRIPEEFLLSNEREKRGQLISALDLLHETLLENEGMLSSLIHRLQVARETKDQLLPYGQIQPVLRRYDELWLNLLRELEVKRVVQNLSIEGVPSVAIATQIVKIACDRSVKLAKEKEAALRVKSLKAQVESDKMKDLVSSSLDPHRRTQEIELSSADMRQQNQNLEAVAGRYREQIDLVNRAIAKAKVGVPKLEEYCTRLKTAAEALELIPSIHAMEEELIEAEVKLHNAWHTYLAECGKVDQKIGVLRAAYPDYSTQNIPRLNEPFLDGSTKIAREKDGLFRQLQPEVVDPENAQDTASALRGVQTQLRAATTSTRMQLRAIEEAMSQALSKQAQLKAEIREHMTTETDKIRMAINDADTSLEIAQDFTREGLDQPISHTLAEIKRYQRILSSAGFTIEPINPDIPLHISPPSSISTTASRLADLKAAFAAGGKTLRGLVDLRQSTEEIKEACNAIFEASSAFVNETQLISSQELEESKAYLALLRSHVEKIDTEAEPEPANQEPRTLRVIQGGK